MINKLTERVLNCSTAHVNNFRLLGLVIKEIDELTLNILIHAHNVNDYNYFFVSIYLILKRYLKHYNNKNNR